jgi:hypothetical protein
LRSKNLVGTVTHIKHLGGVPIIADVATWRMMLIKSIPYADQAGAGNAMAFPFYRNYQ